MSCILKITYVITIPTAKMVLKLAILCLCLFHISSAYTVPEDRRVIPGQIQAAPELPLYYFDNSTYYFQKFFRASQQEGQLFCKNLKMELVSIQSKRENDFLFDTIASLVDYVTTDFLTSGVAAGNIWYWTATGQPFSYTNWGTSIATGDCLEIVYDSSANTMSWSKNNCTEPRYVICEGEGHPTNPPSSYPPSK